MPRRTWYVNESELDDYQIKVIERRTENSFIVKGCAGSGKSILALWKAKQIQATPNMGSFYVIVFTKALRQFMLDGINEIGIKTDRVLYHWQWENTMHKSSADYIIVDEAQDFSKSEIDVFKGAAKKALILYGDSAQQIYNGLKKDLMTMEELAVYTRYPFEQLVFNHRMPKTIAKMAQYLNSEDDDLALRCTKDGNELPKIIKYSSLNAQLDSIITIINNRHFEDIGILFSHNENVKYAFDYLTKKGMNVEARYSRGAQNNVMSLDFSSDNPKLMTYHSAKGVQFESVFLPECSENDKKYKEPIYVAITRSYQSLYIMHSGNLSSFFDEIPSNLYETSLTGQTTSRL